MTEITPFTNAEFELEFIPEGDSFKVVASGLGRSLGFRDAFNLTASIPEAEKGYLLVSTPGDVQLRVLYVTEAGFYRALGQRQAARVPDPALRASVERFQSWVYGEVLPSLRKATSAPREMSRLELIDMARDSELGRIEAENRAAAAEHQVLELAPAARMHDELMDASGDYSVREAALILSRDPRIDTGQRRLFVYLREIGWIGSHNLPYQRHVDCGRLALRVSSYEHPNRDEQVATQQVRISVKGLSELHRMLGGRAQFQALMSEEVAA